MTRSSGPPGNPSFAPKALAEAQHALERMAAELAALERRNDALRARDEYFDQLQAPLWAVDAADRTIDVNPALLAALGYTREEMLGQSPETFLTPDSRETYRAQSILRLAGMADTFEITFVAKDGHPRTFLVSGSPVFRDGDYVGKIAVFRDMSAWRAHVRHELVTPLSSILGFTGVLLRGPPGSLSDEQRNQLEFVQSAAQRMLDLLDRRLGEVSAPGSPGAARGG